MNRTEWYACNDPGLMLEAVSKRASERKLRLLSCAICWHVGKTTGSMVRPEEEFLLHAERQADQPGVVRIRVPYRPEKREWDFWRMIRLLGEESGVNAAAGMIREATGPALLLARVQVQLLHDLFDDRFRPAPLLLGDVADDAEVQRLARSIYGQRLFEEMPVLGDALEEAGCADEEALEHCRQHPLHARGCWVLDTVLARG